MNNLEKFRNEVNELFEQEGWLPCDIVNGGLLMGETKGTCKGCKYENDDCTCKYEKCMADWLLEECEEPTKSAKGHSKNAIVFFLSKQEINVGGGDKTKWKPLTAEETKAIYQQMKELGWFADEEQNRL